MQHSSPDRMLRRRKHEQFQRAPLLGVDLSSVLNPVVDPVVSVVTDLVLPKSQPTPTPPANTPAAPPATTPSPNQPPPQNQPPPATTPAGNGGGNGGDGGGGSSPSSDGGSGNNNTPANTPSSSPSSGSNGSGSVGSGSQPSATSSAPNHGSSPAVNLAPADGGNGGDSNNNGGDAAGNPGGASDSSSSQSSSGGLHTPGSSTIHPSSTIGGSGPNSSSTGADGSGDGGVNNNGPTAVAATSKHGLSTGAIAGIAIAVLVLLAGITMILVRRRYKSQRNQRRDKWMAYGNTPGSNSLPRSGVSSARSSFASPDINQPMTETPFYMHDEMTEKRAPTQMSDLILPPIAVVVEHTGGPSNRNSVYSIGSNSSGHSSHSSGSNYVYLTPASASGAEVAPPSPICVRPFTPSETWSFPKPPVTVTSPTTPSSTINGDHFTEENASFSPVETIMRPFFASMPDELSVVPGDFVRIIKSFDDGWALVEKFGRGEPITGLIPVDCLRPVGEQLPSFVDSKRVSSYGDNLAVPKFT